MYSVKEESYYGPTGVIHGRFQMLHKGHIEYLLAGLERCRYLLIGVSNPDPATTRFTSANPHRSLPLSNPLTYFERFQMIQGALLEAGVAREHFDVVPFPINCPQLLFNYVPLDAKYYMTIYDDWSLEKKATLESLGCGMQRSCGSAAMQKSSPAAPRSAAELWRACPGRTWCRPSPTSM